MSKMTQKILALSFITLQALSATTAFAASNPAYFMPQNPLFYLEMNTSKTNPLQGKLKDLVENSMNSSSNAIASRMFAKAIEQTVIGFAQTQHLADKSDIFMLAFAIDENDFNQIITEATPDELKTTNLPENRKIYLSGDDFFFTYKNGNLVASNLQGIISDVLMSAKTTSLIDNTEYQKFLTQINQGSSQDGFFKAYIDYQKYLSNFSSDFNLGSLSKLIQTEGFALKQGAQSLEGKIYIKYNSDSSTNLQNFQFTPELYQKISAKNLLLFQESNNWVDHLNLLNQSLFNNTELLGGDFVKELSTSINDNLGLDYQKDITPLLRNKVALTIHSDFENQYYPAVSILAQVNGQEAIANSTLTKVQTAIQTQVKKSIQEDRDSQLSMQKYYNDYYKDQVNPYKDIPSLEAMQAKALTTKDLTVNGSTFKQMVFNAPDNGQPNTLSAPKLQFRLAWGITSNGLLVVTTLANPNNLFDDNGGLNNDLGFKNNFANQSLADLSYINIDNIHSYAKTLTNELKAESEISDNIETFLAPLHNFYASSSIQDNTYISNWKLTADIDKFSAYGDLFKSLTDFGNNDYNNYIPDDNYNESGAGFSDVNDNDWFSLAVNSVKDSGLMTGYEDNTFHPNSPITRAEFVKTVIAQLRNTGDWSEEDNQKLFADVSDQEWFAEYANQARSHGIVNGFANNNFSPNQAITRAEAVQILFNASQVLKNSNFQDTENKFSDVNTSDWFYQAVKSAQYNGVVNGKTSWEFKPSDKLTRAETAQMIYNFQNL